MAIESDDKNPDSRLAVQFDRKPRLNQFLSNQEGRPIYEDVDYITIYVPGDSTLTVVSEVRDDHKQRFPIQWARFMNSQVGDQRVVGTPITQWPLVTPSMAEELRALKFFTVESIANASDGQLQSIGMKAGMNALIFRTRAANYLKAAADESLVTRQEDQIKKLAEENARLKEDTDAKMKALQDQMAQLLAASEQKKGR